MIMDLKMWQNLPPLLYNQGRESGDFAMSVQVLWQLETLGAPKHFLLILEFMKQS